VTLQNTITQLISAIRRVAREVPGAAEQIAAVCPGHDYSKAGKPKIDWDDPAAKQELVSALVNDANALVAALEGRKLEEPACSAVALLALVAGQDVEPAPPATTSGSGRPPPGPAGHPRPARQRHHAPQTLTRSSPIQHAPGAGSSL
jgi:hypothetical protein